MRADLRAVALAVFAWAVALLALHTPGSVTAGLLALGALGLALRSRRGLTATPVAWLVVALAVVLSVGLRVGKVEHAGLGRLVHDRASGRVVLTVRSDPVLHQGRFQAFVTFRATLTSVLARGQRLRLRAPVLVIGDPAWRHLRLGTRVASGGRLDVADGRDLAGVLATRGPPRVLSGPGALLRAVDRVRAGIREGVAPRAAGPRALVPALVDGDDTGLASSIATDFRTAGLTHLLAVSGTNLTLIVGFLLVLARWSRVRARGLLVVGLLGVVGFVLLARPEPSVLRAAAMGTVALVGMGVNGRERGARLLGIAVVGLLLVDPWLATSPGFALSTGATAGILFLAPGWRDALQRWLPTWAAEAVAVPLAAQLACTPLVAAISGQVSLVAVAANLLAAPVVGVATVLGLVGGVVAVASADLGHLVAAPAAWCAGWIILVARAAASLPVAAVGWSTSVLGLVLLTTLCAVLVLCLGRLLARRGIALGLGALSVVVLLVPLPTPGWPPPGWVMIACDVGQGDALVLNAGHGRAVVVDAGPRPEYVDRCLRRLHLTHIPLVVLTHFHADHIDGLRGVLRSRRVGEVEVSPVADPLSGARQVRAQAGRLDVPVRLAVLGESATLGQLRWQVLAPIRASYPDSDSPPNDGSVVLLVQVRGVRMLLMGDQERPSQQDLAAAVPGLRADVLKVAHHGSSKQDEALVDALGARLAVISVGRGNDYGHPASSTLRMLRRAGMTVARTDRDGDVAVVVDGHGRVRLRTRVPRDRPPPGSVGWT